MERRTNVIIGSYKRVTVEIKDTVRVRARNFKVLVGDINDVFKDDGTDVADLDPGWIVGVVGHGNATLELLECIDEGNPFALVGIEVDETVKGRKISHACNRSWIITDDNVPERVVVLRIFGLSLLELDDGQGIRGILTNIGLIDQLEHRRLANVLIVLGVGNSGSIANRGGSGENIQ